MKMIPTSRGAHYLARVSILLIAVALAAGIAGCGPDVPPPEALEIRNWHDLDAVRGNLTGSYILMNDLDSATAGYEELASPTANEGSGWDPIGVFDYDAPFVGSVDGGGYEIRDLFINRPGKWGVGLFGALGGAGVIQNIGVVNLTVAGNAPVGALVGDNYGLVVNCYCTMGNVTGDSDVGGLVGYSGRFVINSYYNYDEVLINGQHGISVGALFDESFEEWLANDKFLDVNERLSKENGYYVIDDVGDFKELLAFGQDHTLRFRLINDLDLAGEPNFYIPYLAGEFDGNGHKISNLSFNFSFVSKVGLFGQLASNGTVHDVAAENMNITACSHVGGLVGWNEGDVSDSYSTGNVTGDEDVGGLVGTNYGAVTNSCSTGSVTGDEHVGGLVGTNYGAVTNSCSTGSVTGDKEDVGGLVGWNHRGNVSNSYSTDNVTGRGAVGGLVGVNHFGIVSNSYSTGNVTGMVGVGGLVGANAAGDISDSYSAGNVTGDMGVGGLVGTNGKGSTLSNSYSSGSVTGHEDIGGLVGADSGIVSNSFWDIEISGQSTSAAGMGKTTAEMKNITTFSGAGWNIIAVANPGTRNLAYTWNIVDGETYPFLSWQP